MRSGKCGSGETLLGAHPATWRTRRLASVDSRHCTAGGGAGDIGTTASRRGAPGGRGEPSAHPDAEAHSCKFRWTTETAGPRTSKRGATADLGGALYLRVSWPQSHTASAVTVSITTITSFITILTNTNTIIIISILLREHLINSQNATQAPKQIARTPKENAEGARYV